MPGHDRRSVSRVLKQVVDAEAERRMRELRRQAVLDRRQRRRERLVELATWIAVLLLAVAIVVVGMSGGIEGLLGR